MGVENQQQTNFPKRESQFDEREMDVWMDGWMNEDGWHSLNRNQNNVLDGSKSGSFILKLLGYQWTSSPKQSGRQKSNLFRCVRLTQAS